MIPNPMFASEFTSKIFKNDFSPSGYRITMPGFRSPMAHEEDNSRTTPKLPFTDNLDFESRFLSVTQNYFPYLNQKFVPRTPVSVIKSPYDNGQPRFQNMNKGNNFEQPRVIQAAREGCPCCQQEIPVDMKLIRKVNETRESNNDNFTIQMDKAIESISAIEEKKDVDQDSSSKKGRKRKNKSQIKELEVEFDKNPIWTKEDVDRISERLGMEKSKVYKWNWDQKKKLNILPKRVYVFDVPEGGLPANMKVLPSLSYQQ